MADPVLRSEGNLRFFAVASQGWPSESQPICERARGLAASQPGVASYGPATILLTLPPHDHPAGWECQVGVAVTGLPVPVDDFRVEDYRDLRALVLPHPGPVRDLDVTHRRLVEHARTLGYVIRPYWRVQAWRKRLADGSVWPVSEVSVFLDRF